VLFVAMSSALFAAIGTDYDDLRSYVSRWGVCAIAIASLIAAGRHHHGRGREERDVRERLVLRVRNAAANGGNQARFGHPSGHGGSTRTSAARMTNGSSSSAIDAPSPSRVANCSL
jgi:hypothetical protein